MSNFIIKGARVISPSEGIDGKLTVHIKDAMIAGLYDDFAPVEKIDKSAEVIGANGHVLTPGIIDMHVHLREPGYEYKETIASGTEAAYRAGVTSVACMANTNPVNDSAAVTKFILEQAKKAGFAGVYPIGAMTIGLKGEELAEYGELKEAGCVAISDDGKSVKSALTMRRVMEYAKTFDLLCISHAEDADLADGGQINEGSTSTLLGLAGIPSTAEDVIVARDIALAELTGCRVHIAHVSTKGALELIKSAKKRGAPVTCETAPHYFTLTDEDITDYNTNFKVNPPLRSPADKAAIIKGLKDGTIDVIASDHAPHHADEKNVEFMYAAFGISGVETIMQLTLKLVHEGIFTMNDFVKKLCENPAKILGLANKGVIRVGADADLILINMDNKFALSSETMISKGKNSPFIGWELKGRAGDVFIKGKRMHI